MSELMTPEEFLEHHGVKADYILDSIAKNPENTLVKLKGPGGARVLATGNEVMNYLERGGAMDMRYTDIVAVLPSEKKN